MPAKKPDRRVQRTAQLLRDALIPLMVEHGYENVTVQDILDRAGVGRSTFYAHFRDKEELLKSSLEGLRKWLFHTWKSDLAAQSKAPGEMGFVLPFLQHVDSHRHLWKAIVGRESGTIVDRQLRRMLMDMAREDLASRDSAPKERVMFDAVVQHVVGALMSLMIWWMDHKPRLSAEEMNRIFLKLTLDGLNNIH